MSHRLRILGALLILSMQHFIAAQDCGLQPPQVGDLLAPQLSVLWPNGVVPYEFQPGIAVGGEQDMREALDAVEAVCGVRFVERTNQADYVQVFQQPIATGFSQSQLGRQGGAQWLRIRFGVAGRFGIVHEVLHTLGVWHEHQRPDRNNFVIYNATNVQQGMGGNFTIDNSISTATPYDFNSIMHYGSWTFSTCSNTLGPPCDATNQTLTTINPAMQSVIGQRSFLSLGDAAGLQSLYGLPAPPAISFIQPTFISPDTPNAIIQVDGERFMRTNSLNANAVQRTILRIDGQVVPTTILANGRLQATVPANILAIEGYHTVTLENPLPSGGGVSNSVQFLVGVTPGQKLAESMITIDDVNNDGVRDVVACAPEWSQGRGLVRCYSGSNLQTVLWNFEGQSPGQRLGASIISLGDFGNNGTQDIAVGAPGRNNGAGGVAIIRAATGSFVGWVGTPASGEAFGTALANAGDVNQDGQDDFLIGAPGHLGGAGRVLIHSGTNGALIRSMVGAGTDRLGASVAGGVDFTGDGAPDVLAGAPGASNNGPNTGAAYFLDPQANHPIFGPLLARVNGSFAGAAFGSGVALIQTPEGARAFVGAPGLSAVQVLDASTRSLMESIPGKAGFTDFGERVIALHDLDEDSVQDVAVHAKDLGGPGGLLLISGYELNKRYWYTGQSNGEEFGASAAFLGDRNDDAQFDVVIGAPKRDGAVTEQGGLSTRTIRWPAADRRFLINEVVLINNGAGVEIINNDRIARNLEGYSLIWRMHSPNETRVSSVFPERWVASDAMVFVTRASATLSPAWADFQRINAFSLNLSTLAPLTVALLDPDGVVVDEVRVDGSSAPHPGSSLGGRFRGSVPRPPLSIAVERIGGLDSQSAADWTVQRESSITLANRSSGLRGIDPSLPASVKINEIVTSPDWIELRPENQAVDLAGWSLRFGLTGGVNGLRIFPWIESTLVFPNEFPVVGDSLPLPTELPNSAPVVTLATLGLGNIPLTNAPFEVGLYDDRGRLIDLVRSTGLNEQRIHNHPRMPSAPDDFVGGVLRTAAPSGPSIVARQLLADTNTGSDWRCTTVRSLGSANPLLGFYGTVGFDDPIDVRLDATGIGGGLALVVNAGPAASGLTWRILFSLGHGQGQGPIFGLGLDAVDNFVQFGPLLGDVLDAEGSARMDLAPLSLPPGVLFDAIFYLEGPNGYDRRTLVVEFDSDTVPL